MKKLAEMTSMSRRELDALREDNRQRGCKLLPVFLRDAEAMPPAALAEFAATMLEQYLIGRAIALDEDRRHA